MRQLHRSSHAVIALDSEGASWRRDLFDGYKRGRQRIIFPWSERFAQHLAASGWHCIKIEGQEADDILASLSARAVDKGITVSILSGDSDLLQIMGPSCHVYSFGTNGEPRYCRRDEGYLLQRYGVRSGAQLTMWKALVGEPGDGLPGVAKIGKVKAAKLIQRYPTPEELRAFGVLKSSEREQFDLMYSLVQLRENIPIDPISPSACLIPEAK